MAEIALEIRESGADDERLEELARSLRQELEGLDIDRIERARGGAAPPGTRSFELATIATLLLTMKDSSVLVGQFIGAVRSWLGRGSSGTKSIRLTMGDKSIELTGARDEVTDRLVGEFLRSVAGQ